MVITITGTTGIGPYQVQVCDITNTTCIIVTGATSIPPSFTFDVPSPLDGVSSLLVKIIDSNGCEVFQVYSCPPTYTLLKELKDTYNYPIDGWSWYDEQPKGLN